MARYFLTMLIVLRYLQANASAADLPENSKWVDFLGFLVRVLAQSCRLEASRAAQNRYYRTKKVLKDFWSSMLRL